MIRCIWCLMAVWRVANWFIFKQTQTEGKKKHVLHFVKQFKNREKDIFDPDSLQVVAESDSRGMVSCCCNTKSSKVRPESPNSIKDWSPLRQIRSVLSPAILCHSDDFISRAKMSVSAEACLDTNLSWTERATTSNNGREAQGGASLSHTPVTVHLLQQIHTWSTMQRRDNRVYILHLCAHTCTQWAFILNRAAQKIKP